MEQTVMNTEAANASKKGNSGNGGRYKGKPKGKQASTKSYKETFKGECEGLQGKTFYIGSTKQADNYNQTLEAILDYIMREYNNGMDVREALESMEEKDFSVEMPKIMTLDDKATAEEKKSAEKLHDIELKLFVERKDKYRINMIKSYGLIWGQCTKALKNKIEARKDWNQGASKIKMNPIMLLRAIKEITHNHQEHKYIMESMYNCLRNVFTMKQEDNENLTEFTRRFKNAVDIMESVHGPLHMIKYMESRSDYQAIPSTDIEQRGNLIEHHYNKFLSYIYLRALDQKKSGKLVEDLGNQFALGDNKFPTSVSHATEMVVAYRNRINNPNQHRQNSNNNRNNRGHSTTTTTTTTTMYHLDKHQRVERVSTGSTMQLVTTVERKGIWQETVQNPIVKMEMEMERKHHTCSGLINRMTTMTLRMHFQTLEVAL